MLLSALMVGTGVGYAVDEGDDTRRLRTLYGY
jgi:hypothetical protein